MDNLKDIIDGFKLMFTVIIDIISFRWLTVLFDFLKGK